MLFRSQNAIEDIDKNALLQLVRTLASIESYNESGYYGSDHFSLEDVVGDAIKNRTILLRADKTGEFQDPGNSKSKSSEPDISECFILLNADINAYLPKVSHDDISLRVPRTELLKMKGFKLLDKLYLGESQSKAGSDANHALTSLFIREIKSGEPYRKQDGVSFIKAFEKSEDPAGYILDTMRGFADKKMGNNEIEMQDMSGKTGGNKMK
tara:strand:- start:168 stop:800 length:633 start_codon:yes stop_codon:yes gene_type:complete